MSVHEHKERAKKRVGCFVLTVSDSRNEETDHSGQLIKALLAENRHTLIGYQITRDEPDMIRQLLEDALSKKEVDVIIVNGGTGISPRDGTYEVISQLLEKKLDGFGELFRFLSYQEIGSAAMMSRAVAGVANGTVMISLPGSKAAVELAMHRLVLPELGHMVSQLQGHEG